MSDPKEVADLIAWLKERAKPDSGIDFEAGGLVGSDRCTVFGTDARFVLDHFHGKGAAKLASALHSISADRDAADNALVDKYRDPKSGTFSFPGDVAAIIRRMDAAEASTSALTKTLEAIKDRADDGQAHGMRADLVCEEISEVIEVVLAEIAALRPQNQGEGDAR